MDRILPFPGADDPAGAPGGPRRRETLFPVRPVARAMTSGIEPGRAEAVQVLREIGIDISGHRSKGLDAIEASSVDAVIALCAEEVCPVFLGKVHRLHRGLPDPAAVAGSEETRQAAFREVRDELRRRLAVLFSR